MSTKTDGSGSLLASLRSELKALFEGGHAHATLEDAVRDFPKDLRGVTPQGLPYSAWQIVEHLRIAQQDMLEYSDNADGDYKPMKWPEAYWPEAAAPPSDAAWDDALEAIHADRKKFEALLDDATELSLVGPFAWGEGQTLLREAFQIIDHNAYHVGELIVVRRLLGAWKK